jgi:uncharacterized protein (TIGR03083 family)
MNATELDNVDLGALYRLTRKRVSALVMGTDQHDVAVPACPGWSVHDVTAHLVAVVEDAMAGRVTGLPTDEFTATQVARYRDHSVADMIDQWDETAGPFEDAIASLGMWPAFLDALAHEHDIRGALGLPAGRDSEEVVLASARLISTLRPSQRLVVQVGDEEFVAGPEDGSALHLTTTSFEAFRFRLGRRSQAQIRSMGWSGNPQPVLRELTIFGPSPLDIVE